MGIKKFVRKQTKGLRKARTESIKFRKEVKEARLRVLRESYKKEALKIARSQGRKLAKPRKKITEKQVLDTLFVPTRKWNF